MRSIRAIAAAMVAVCISCWGASLLAQTIPSQSAPDQLNVEHREDSIPRAEAIKATIGLRARDPGFDPKADLNGDGIINALDVALFRLGRTSEPRARSSATDPRLPQGSNPGETAVTGERVIVEGQTTIALPGQTVSVLFLIRDNTTPILSYTVETNAVAQAGATGIVTANVVMTNFYDQRNLITAGGAMRDPFFSMIEENGSGGVSVTTITADLSTVLAVDNVNDVLAQVFFDVPPDALGDFTIQLGAASILVDGNAAPVPFAFTPGSIRVLDPNEIPTVSEWGLVVMSLLVLTAGSVVFAKRHGVAASKVGQW